MCGSVSCIELPAFAWRHATQIHSLSHAMAEEKVAVVHAVDPSWGPVALYPYLTCAAEDAKVMCFYSLVDLSLVTEVELPEPVLDVRVVEGCKLLAVLTSSKLYLCDPLNLTIHEESKYNEGVVEMPIDEMARVALGVPPFARLATWRHGLAAVTEDANGPLAIVLIDPERGPTVGHVSLALAAAEAAGPASPAIVLVKQLLAIESSGDASRVWLALVTDAGTRIGKLEQGQWETGRVHSALRLVATSPSELNCFVAVNDATNQLAVYDLEQQQVVQAPPPTPATVGRCSSRDCKEITAVHRNLITLRSSNNVTLFERPKAGMQARAEPNRVRLFACDPTSFVLPVEDCGTLIVQRDPFGTAQWIPKDQARAVTLHAPQLLPADLVSVVVVPVPDLTCAATQSASREGAGLPFCCCVVSRTSIHIWPLDTLLRCTPPPQTPQQLARPAPQATTTTSTIGSKPTPPRPYWVTQHAPAARTGAAVVPPASPTRGVQTAHQLRAARRALLRAGAPQQQRRAPPPPPPPPSSTSPLTQSTAAAVTSQTAATAATRQPPRAARAVPKPTTNRRKAKQLAIGRAGGGGGAGPAFRGGPRHASQLFSPFNP